MNVFKLFKNKTVVVTGHTGFKGSWLSLWLSLLGAKLLVFLNQCLQNHQIFKF